MRKLEIGSGNRPLPGYEHLDCNANCPDVDYVCSMDDIPVEDNSFDEIKSIHSIEHIHWRKLVPTLTEWYRVLKPNGRVHIACPNLDFICRAYIANGYQWFDDFSNMHKDEQAYLKINGFHCHSLWANFKIFSSGGDDDIHYACYDSFLLGQGLQAAGFKHIKTLENGESLVMEAKK